jgi:hypothetical protein
MLANAAQAAVSASKPRPIAETMKAICSRSASGALCGAVPVIARATAERLE